MVSRPASRLTTQSAEPTHCTHRRSSRDISPPLRLPRRPLCVVQSAFPHVSRTPRCIMPYPLSAEARPPLCLHRTTSIPLAAQSGARLAWRVGGRNVTPCADGTFARQRASVADEGWRDSRTMAFHERRNVRPSLLIGLRRTCPARRLVPQRGGTVGGQASAARPGFPQSGRGRARGLYVYSYQIGGGANQIRSGGRGSEEFASGPCGDGALRG